MSTVEDWLGLPGEALEQAMLSASWFVHANDNDPGGHGWCVMPVDLPPSSGVHAVAETPWRTVAEGIAWTHNAVLEGL